MYEEITEKRYLYEQALHREYAELERNKINNEKMDKYRKMLRELQSVYDRAGMYLNAVKVVETAVIKEANDYQTRRIDFLNKIITDAIGRIFPDRDVRAELKSMHSRTDKVSLKLYDSLGNDFSPYVCEGKLMQYLISVAAVAAIIKSMGCSSIFIDEAFGVAREDHMDDLGALLGSFVDGGLQTVVISQNPSLYANLPRHEIHLETASNGYERYAVVTKIEDVDIFSDDSEVISDDKN